MSKAAIYNSTWDSLGGGERYTAAFAQCLENLDYSVDIFSPTDFSSQISSRFDINFSKKIRFINYDPLKDNFLSRLRKLSSYDLLFWVSDGSIPISFAKKTLIHFQIPFTSSNYLDRIKLKMYTGVCNSNFTKHYIDKSFDTFTQVLYPPTDTENFTPGVKQNTLISLARFSRHLHSKRQDLLIDAFSKLHNQVKDWQLFLVGGSEDEKYVEELRTQSNDLPIRFFINPKASEVKNLLTTSKIFWSATGLGSDATTHPEKMEHFGITVVEAMAAGCVPIVSQMGGHLETVTDSCGFFFNSAAELADKTVSLIKDPKKLSNFSQNAITRSKLFDTTIFNAKIKSLLI